MNPYEGLEYLRKLREVLLPEKKEALDRAFKSLKKPIKCESDQKLISVARRCLLITPEERPPMDEIIVQLSQIKI